MDSIISRLKTKSGLIAIFSISLICIASVFIFQSKFTNFRRGHHGWVSSHVLAIADKASAKNHFVGYTCATDKWQNSYYYFDRYPIFFAALSRILLQTQHLPGDKIRLSRQIGNAIYVVIFILVFFFSESLFQRLDKVSVARLIFGKWNTLY